MGSLNQVVMQRTAFVVRASQFDTLACFVGSKLSEPCEPDPVVELLRERCCDEDNGALVREGILPETMSTWTSSKFVNLSRDRQRGTRIGATAMKVDVSLPDRRELPLKMGVEACSLLSRWLNPIPATPPHVVRTPHPHGAPTTEETSAVELAYEC